VIPWPHCLQGVDVYQRQLLSLKDVCDLKLFLHDSLIPQLKERTCDRDAIWTFVNKFCLDFVELIPTHSTCVQDLLTNMRDHFVFVENSKDSFLIKHY
jgi:hypothetical protein